jgi:chemotaxis response regulator CheB
MTIGIVTPRPLEAEILCQAIGEGRQHRVIWIAECGASAVALCAKETPDLILMTMLDGAESIDATDRIMASTPCAILIVTGSLRLDSARVFEALGRGALDAVDMPESASRQHAAPLITRIALVSRLLGERAASARTVLDSATPLTEETLVAIGASTGGPAALAEVLRGLPADFPAAIIVVQHVDAQFAVGMAEWLTQQSRFPVTIAKPRERPAAGRVLLAGTSGHLTLMRGHRLGYSDEPRDCSYIPSVDVFFESVSRLWSGAAVGVLLTGMGGDGAIGLKAMRTRGHHTIAQDRATSAVYGMPKVAATMNAAVDILPMDRIAARLVEVVCGQAVAPVKAE